MPPETTAIQTAERLLIVTYALAEAASRSDNSELQALFSERAKLLSTLESSETNAEVLNLLRKTQIAETEALAAFNRSKASAVRDLETGLHGRKVIGTYASAARSHAFDVNQ